MKIQIRYPCDLIGLDLGHLRARLKLTLRQAMFASLSFLFSKLRLYVCLPGACGAWHCSVLPVAMLAIYISMKQGVANIEQATQHCFADCPACRVLEYHTCTSNQADFHASTPKHRPLKSVSLFECNLAHADLDVSSPFLP